MAMVPFRSMRLVSVYQIYIAQSNHGKDFSAHSTGVRYLMVRERPKTRHPPGANTMNVEDFTNFRTPDFGLGSIPCDD
jgi:hypothetical protein